MNHCVLTGCTGFLGLYLLRDLLVRDVPVIVLVRDAPGTTAASRVNAIVRSWEDRLGAMLPRPRCIAADLRQDGLGIQSADARILSECDSLIHCAANLSFHSKNEDSEPWETNVHGTMRLVDLALSLGIKHFHHISTAYVCGDRSGRILERELDTGQGFGSDYERSKFASEQLVRESPLEKLNVFRPGVITGDYRSGYTSTFHGPYFFAQFAQKHRAAIFASDRSRQPRVRLFKKRDEVHHLMPVDFVSQAIVRIAGMSDRAGDTYHLTPVSPCSSQLMAEAFQTFFPFESALQDQPPPPPDDFNELERAFYTAMSGLEHRYLATDPEFDCANTIAAIPGWQDLVVDKDYLERTLAYALECNFASRLP